MKDSTFTAMSLPRRQLRFGCCILTVASLGLVSCARITSAKVESLPKDRAWGDPVAYGRYYLPIPHLEVYAFESALVRNDQFLQIVVRPVVKPDVTQPLALTQNYSAWVQQNLNVSFTPEGFLEHVALYREPKQAEAAVAIGRTVMALAGPVPLPVKGLPELPEFSKLVYQRLFPLCAFAPVKGQGASVSTNLTIKGAPYQLTVSYASNPSTTNYLTISGSAKDLKCFGGVYYRPLIPVTVTLQQQAKVLGSPVETTLQFISEPQDPALKTVLTAATNTKATITITNDTVTTLHVTTPLPNGHNDRISSSYATHGTMKSSTDAGGQKLQGTLGIVADSQDDPNGLRLEQVLYCPDPSTIDRFKVPGSLLAKQGVDLRFSGGTLYEIEASRDSEWLEAAKVPLQIVGGVAAAPSAVFNFKVEMTHKDESAKRRSGDKDPGRGSNPPPKE